MNNWAIKVVWPDGDEEFVKEGRAVAGFPSQERARETADFLRQGLDDEDVQSINVVPYPHDDRREESAHAKS